ncbi:TonB-dependent receptor [Altibacter sp. HG106]|uniref:TonB-dependent receptor n=1 Tax=Altibacter sp. HG106 TaxID=3023937 RepID=UPI002350C380|nr:TonB-dependent receptor plug domain-containing protein [Altibacter sp. HG106]
MLQQKIKWTAVRLIIISILLLAPKTWGQNTGAQPLTAILTLLETQYDVRFSYDASVVLDVRLPPPSKQNSLSESLAYLRAQTDLTFTTIDTRYIAVTKKGVPTTERCGQLIDGLQRVPLSEATITMTDGSFRTTTNQQGYFSIPEGSSGTMLRISHVGYETLTLPVAALRNNCPQFLMFTAISLLETVRIQGILVQGIDQNADGSTVVKADDFSLVPGQVENDVLQVVQNVPGVESVNETISTINIRGGNNDENVVLWDGIRMYQTGHFFGLISAYNPYITERLKVYKNGAPAWYGESVSGIIAMHSSNKKPDRFQGGLGFNLLNANAMANIPISDKAYVQVSGRRSINNIVESPAYATYSQRIFQNTDITNLESGVNETDIETREDFVFYDLSGKLSWQFTPKDRLQWNLIAIDNDLDIVEEIPSNAISETNKLDQTSLATGLQWERNWSRRFRTEVQAYVSYYFLAAFNADLLSRQALLQENEVLDLSVQANTQFSLSENMAWHNGYHFSEVGIANTQDVNLPRFRDYEKDVLRTHVVYSQMDLSLHEGRTVIRGGLRGHYFEKFSSFRLEPRLHIWQDLGNGFAVEASGEFRNQTTTQRIDFNSDFLGLEKRRWILADAEDTPIKTSKQASLGLSYAKKSWVLNATGFYKSVEGVGSNSQGFQNQFQLARVVGSYSVYGVEALISRKVNDFYGWIAYIYNNNEYDFPDLLPAVFPSNFDVRHRLTLAGTYVWKGLKMSAGLRMNTGKPYTVPLEGNEIDTSADTPQLVYDRPNQERLPNYIRADLAAEYVWELSERSDLKMNVALLNVLNRKNILNIRYVLNTNSEGTPVVQQIEESSLGFTPNVSVQWLF